MFKKSNVGDQLLIAVKLNKISEISRLVALGVNVDSRIDKNGKTALHFAAHKGQLLAVKALIEAGADLNITDENGVTALHRAIIHGHAGVVHTLLEAGCSVDETDENGNTALHEAAWNGYSKCVELLVGANCNVNIHNRTGYTSLHLAAQNCHCTTLQVLLDGGSNTLVKNNYGDTPLHIAVRYGHIEVCNILMETKINISEQNNDGNTPLHIAASMGHEELTEMLLKAGSIVTVKNNVGDTARDMAVRNGYKKIAKLLAPARGDTLKMFGRKERRRPHSADVSYLFSGTTDSTLTTTATHLWVPKPVSLDPDSKKQGHKRDLVWSRRRKEERKPKVLTIKYDEMCSIERDYLKKRNASMRKSHKSQSKSSIKSQEERFRSDPVLHQKTKKSHSPEKVDGKAKSAQSRDDLEASLSHKKSKKDKGFFSLFRSASDTELNNDDQRNGVCGKKHKDKYPPHGEVMGNGVHHVGKEVKEKGDTEETKEKKEKRKSEKSEEKTEKKERTGKKNREEEKEKTEKKEKRKEKEKEKKGSRRDENDGSESDCTICQEKRRKSREKSHSKESRHKEQRSKSEHRRTKDHKETDHDKTPVDRKDEEKEHKKKKHHKDKERDKEHRDKDRERDHRDKDREKDRSRRDKNHRKKTEEQEADIGTTPCNQTHCSTCQAQLSRLEAWQERCTSEIDSARRRLEHRLQRLEKKLEEQLREERHLKDKKEGRDKERDRTVGPVKEEGRAVSKNFKDSSSNVKEEIRGLIKGGLSKLELKLGQISAGYDIPFMDYQERCNPELGKNCSAGRRTRHMRSRSSPHLGRAPCEDCIHVMEQRVGGVSPHLASLATSGSSSRATSGIRVSDSGSLDTVIEARPVNDKGLRASGTIIEARPVDDEGLDTVIEAQPVIEDENDLKINDTFAATQVQHQRQVQEVEKWWRAKAEEEQRVLYARICELEQMLLMSRDGRDCFV